MSRCFPYPPPGYSGKSSNEALIESIKLQREREKAKAERKKEKKREKKEKKREKKEKKRGETEKKVQKKIASASHDKKTDDQAFGIGIGPNSVHKEKRKGVNAEPLERSSLSEEHDLPVTIVKPSYSSESTQNSNKRKRDALPGPSCSTGAGKVIKIRLPLQREAVSEKEPKCSTSGPTEFVAAQSAKHTVIQDLGSKEEQNRLTCSTSKLAEAAFSPVVEAPAISKEQKKRQKLNSRYDKVMGNWVPPPLHSSLFDFGLEQDDWLSSKKHQEEHGEKNYTPSRASSDLLQPRAQFLPHVNIYAMPFTVPF